MIKQGLILSVCLLLLVTSANAYVKCGSGDMETNPEHTFMWCGRDRVELVTKDPTTWEELKGPFKGVVDIYPLARYANVYFKGNQTPYTEFTLIYYGGQGQNDLWPYATCIGEGTANKKGLLSIRGRLDKSLYSKNDGVEQKIWVVLSSDVDCSQGKMIAWQPEKYLFERWTI